MSTPQYLPPDKQRDPDQSSSEETPRPDAAAGYAPPDASAGTPSDAPAAGYVPPGAVGSGQPSTPAAGYVPPGASPGTPPVASATGYVPPGVSLTEQAGPQASGYTPPGVSAQAQPNAPASGYTPPSVGGTFTPPAGPHHPPTPHVPPVVLEPPAAEPATGELTPEASEELAVRRPSRLLVIGGAVVALLLVGLAIAWLLGAFAPKMTRLPATAGAYSLDTSTRKSTATVLDSATFRAGSGDVYQASIVKNAPDPKAAFDKAASDTRLQLGSVYCTGVSKTGKGATCGVLLATGSVVTVEGSTRHTAQEVAQFTETLAAGVK